jgi:thiamine biosynthesis lipoprotein
MGCPCELRLYAGSAEQAGRGFELAKAEVDRLDRKYSHYRDDSLLSTMQRQAARTGGVVVDSETAALLNYADTQFRVSEGLFDITARSLSALWDRARSLPADEQISDALDKTGWNRVRWDGTNLESPTGMSFDLGGIVKEYAADRAAVTLKEAGFESGYVDLGGDLHVLGPHPDGRPWQVGIRNPNDKGSPLAAVEVRSGGLASSGDYERFSEINGRRYGHIINPRTGWPVSVAAESLASVSAVAPSCLLAGSVTTLAMLAGAKQGISLLEESGLSWFAVAADHSVSGTLAPSKLQTGA